MGGSGFAGAGYVVESNREYGDGRPDVVVKEKRKRRVMVFEAKYIDENETFAHALKEAVNHIKIRIKNRCGSFYAHFTKQALTFCMFFFLENLDMDLYKV